MRGIRTLTHACVGAVIINYDLLTLIIVAMISVIRLFNWNYDTREDSHFFLFTTRRQRRIIKFVANENPFILSRKFIYFNQRQQS